MEEQELVKSSDGRILGRVVADEEFATNRKVIQPESTDVVDELIVMIQEAFTEARATSKIIVNHNQGGVTTIETLHVKNGLEGLFDDEEDDDDESDEDSSEEETN
jgi:regulator of RNase E activity RraB